FLVSFTKTQGLSKHDDVLVYGYRIGRVRDIALERDHQIVEIEIDRSVVLRKKATAEIQRVDAFGTVAIFVDPGEEGETLPPDSGSVILGTVRAEIESTPEDVASPRAISEALGQLEQVT